VALKSSRQNVAIKAPATIAPARVARQNFEAMAEQRVFLLEQYALELEKRVCTLESNAFVAENTRGLEARLQLLEMPEQHAQRFKIEELLQRVEKLENELAKK